MDLFLLPVLLAPLLVGVLAFSRALGRDDPFSAFTFALGATWLGVIGLSIVIGLVSDAVTLRAVNSPKYYATPIMALAAVGLGLVMGLVSGACAWLVVRARVQEQTRAVFRANEASTSAENQRYSPYFSGKPGDRTDA